MRFLPRESEVLYATSTCRNNGRGGSADALTAWIVRHDEDLPRFVSAYVREE
jgi:hypothetical protein